MTSTTYVQYKFCQRNIDACPPITFMTSPILTLVSMCLLMSWLNYLFGLQKETNSKTKLIRGVYSNKISWRQCTKEMGEGRIVNLAIAETYIKLNTHFATVVSFELHKETKSKRNKFREFTQTKFPADNAQEKWGNVTSLAYRTGGQGLLAFLSQSWYCLDPRKGAKFIQMKFHGTCLVKETDFYRFHS